MTDVLAGGSPPTLLVVGGGPAGVTAALQASELGARVTLLEAAQVGGTSLNSGPAPVRTLARAARLARDWSSWAAFGLHRPAAIAPTCPPSWPTASRVARYAHEKKDLSGRIRRCGVDLIEDLGPVSFTGPRALAADGGRTWTADSIILAVGGHAARLPIPGADLALTYEDIPSLASLPDRVAVIGGAVPAARWRPSSPISALRSRCSRPGPSWSRPLTRTCRTSLTAPSAAGA